MSDSGDAGHVDGQIMSRCRRDNNLETWEIALIKAMLVRGGYDDQDILAYFTRPTRSVNHCVIGEIRNETKHKLSTPASEKQLDEFLDSWPNIDQDTGLSLRGDELLIKAREAMIAAVHIFNGAGLTFRTELFIVTAIIAWTYLLHAWFKREGIDYHYNQKTALGEYKYWELGKCLKHARCPVPTGAKRNLEFLLGLRHEIEHRCTSRIDDAIWEHLQSCCINFDKAIKEFFGDRHGLEKRLPIALQFVSFGADQREILKKASNLPQHVSTFIDAFEHGLTSEQLADPAYRMRVAFVQLASNRASGADRVIEFVKPDDKETTASNGIVFKEINKKRHTPKQVVELMKEEGYRKFSIFHHTKFWQEIKAKDPDKGYGCKGDYKNWVWFNNWIDRVRKHCEENMERYT